MRYEAAFGSDDKTLIIGKYDENASIAIFIDLNTLNAKKIIHFDSDLVASIDITINQDQYDEALFLCEFHDNKLLDEKKVKALLNKIFII